MSEIRWVFAELDESELSEWREWRVGVHVDQIVALFKSWRYGLGALSKPVEEAKVNRRLPIARRRVIRAVGEIFDLEVFSRARPPRRV